MDRNFLFQKGIGNKLVISDMGININMHVYSYQALKNLTENPIYNGIFSIEKKHPFIEFIFFICYYF